MSKEFKLVFEPEMKIGDVISRFTQEDNDWYLMQENGTWIHAGNTEKENYVFNIGDEYTRVSSNILGEYGQWEDNSPAKTTLIKIL
jgi:hypothetical protein|nr:MAG TPA: hypothetical protein [Caudoviricetes sp.]